MRVHTSNIEAIAYAREAHTGLMRKTDEPYITHCVHTARILAALVPAHGKRVFFLSDSSEILVVVCMVVRSHFY